MSGLQPDPRTDDGAAGGGGAGSPGGPEYRPMPVIVLATVDDD